MEIESMDWEQFDKACSNLASLIKNIKIDGIYGIPRGGLCPAVRLSHLLDIPLKSKEEITNYTLIVDDVIDTGRTLEYYIINNYKTATLYYKPCSKYKPTFYSLETSKYVLFPWETKTI